MCIKLVFYFFNKYGYFLMFHFSIKITAQMKWNGKNH